MSVLLGLSLSTTHTLIDFMYNDFELELLLMFLGGWEVGYWRFKWDVWAGFGSLELVWDEMLRLECN